MKPVKVTVLLEVNDNDDMENVLDSVENLLLDDSWDVTEIYAEEVE